jgi:hypothetical protein
MAAKASGAKQSVGQMMARPSHACCRTSKVIEVRSLRGISQNNQVTLHVILLGIGGTIYNQYTITPLLNLGIRTQKVHQLATKLHCHAIKGLNKSCFCYYLVQQDYKNKTQNTP